MVIMEIVMFNTFPCNFQSGASNQPEHPGNECIVDDHQGRWPSLFESA